MKPDQFKKYFADLKIKLNQALKYDIPKKIGNNAVSLFKDNFQKESFFGKKWDEVLRRKSHSSIRLRAAEQREKATFGKGAYSKERYLQEQPSNLGGLFATKLMRKGWYLFRFRILKIHNEAGR